MDNTNTNTNTGAHAPGVGVSTAGAFTHASGNNLSEGVRKANEHLRGGGANNATSWHGSSSANTKPAETKSIDANTKADVSAKTTTAPSDSSFDTSYLDPSYSAANTSYAASQASSDPFDTDYLNEASENVKNWNKMVEENAKKGNELAYTRGDYERASEDYHNAINALQDFTEIDLIGRIRDAVTGDSPRPSETEHTEYNPYNSSDRRTYREMEYSGSDPEKRSRVNEYNNALRRLEDVSKDIATYGETSRGGISAATEANIFKNENNYLVRRAQTALENGDLETAQRSIEEYDRNRRNFESESPAGSQYMREFNGGMSNPLVQMSNLQTQLASALRDRDAREAEAARRAEAERARTAPTRTTAAPARATTTPASTESARPTPAPTPEVASTPATPSTSANDLSIPSNDELRSSIANAPESIADRAPASKETMDDIKRKHGWLGNDKDGASSFKDGKSKSEVETETGSDETETVDELLEEGKTKYEGDDYNNWEKIVTIIAGKKGVEHVARRKADVESLVENIKEGNVKDAAKDLLTVGKDVAVDVIIAAATGGVGAISGALKNVLLYTWNEMKATGFAPYTGDKAHDSKNRLDAETIRMVDKFFGEDVTGADNLTVSTSNTSATKESDYNKGLSDETNDVVSDCSKKYIIANPWILKAIKKW